MQPTKSQIKQLKYLRKIKMMTQQEIADYMDFSKTYVSLVENHKEIPTYETYLKWLRFMQSKQSKLLQLDWN